MLTTASKVYHGACHCGDVSFEVSAAAHLEVEDCNCSICVKTGFLHLIVPLEQFTLVSGEACLSTYTFNTGIAKHTFCKTCGIKPFYVPRSNPKAIDINVRCLTPYPTRMTVVKFDGQNWELNAHTLSHKG